MGGIVDFRAGLNLATCISSTQLMDPLKQQVLLWTQHYGYHAVVPSLLLDPAGVPWAWIFLMMLAEEAGRSVPLMLLYGFLVMTLVDHALYGVGVLGGRRLLLRVGRRWPKIVDVISNAERVVCSKGGWAVAAGRFMPLLGRWVGLAAGLTNVPYRCFALYDAIGVFITVVGFGLLASFVGRKTIDHPWFTSALTCVVLGAIMVSIGTCGWHWWRARQRAVQQSS